MRFICVALLSSGAAAAFSQVKWNQGCSSYNAPEDTNVGRGDCCQACLQQGLGAANPDDGFIYISSNWGSDCRCCNIPLEWSGQILSHDVYQCDPGPPAQPPMPPARPPLATELEGILARIAELEAEVVQLRAGERIAQLEAEVVQLREGQGGCITSEIETGGEQQMCVLKPRNSTDGLSLRAYNPAGG